MEHGRRGDRPGERVPGAGTKTLEQRVEDLERLVSLLGLVGEAVREDEAEDEEPSLDEQSRRFVNRIREREGKS